MATSHLEPYGPAEHHPAPARSAWQRRVRAPVFWAFLAFAVVGLYYLLTEHPAHFLGYLPFALLLLCPFLHLFGGHGGHGAHGSHGGEETSSHEQERIP